MSQSTTTDADASETVHPNKPHDEIQDENKDLSQHNQTTSKTHGKTEDHDRTNTRRKSDATEHTTTRRKSDAERHAYADAHTKDHHSGIHSPF